VAREYHDLKIDGKEAVGAILDGYRKALEQGGHAFVLAEHHTALREMALYRLHDPESFWHKLESLPTVKSPIPAAVLASLRRALPSADSRRGSSIASPASGAWGASGSSRSPRGVGGGSRGRPRHSLPWLRRSTMTRSCAAAFAVPIRASGRTVPGSCGGSHRSARTPSCTSSHANA